MSVFNAYMSLSGAVDADITRDEPLSRRTSYRIGGPAALVVQPRDYAALADSINPDSGVEWTLINDITYADVPRRIVSDTGGGMGGLGHEGQRPALGHHVRDDHRRRVLDDAPGSQTKPNVFFRRGTV